MPIPVIACGAGRMGSTVIESISKDGRFRLVAVVTSGTAAYWLAASTVTAVGTPRAAV